MRPSRAAALAVLVLTAVLASVAVPAGLARAAAPAIESPGVNLFELIPWAQVEASTPCGVGSIIRGVDSIVYDERLGNPGVPVNPVAGCAEFRFPYKAPYPTDQVHVRFGYNVNYTTPSGETNFPGAQTLAIEGPGPSAPPATFKEQEVSFDEHWGHADHGWVQDPGDAIPVHFGAGDLQEGDVVWRFQDASDGPPSLGGAAVGSGHLRAELRSDFAPPGILFRETDADFPWMPSHVEYSSVAYPNMRVETRDNVYGGRVHKETHFLVDVTPEVLDRYWVSTQVTMPPGTQFSRIVLPDGSNLTTTASFDGTDWRNLASEAAKLQPLVNGPGRQQVTIPATLISHAGPGTYDLVVERPGDSYPLANARLSGLFVVVMVAPGLVALMALRNVRRLLAVLGSSQAQGKTDTPRRVLIAWLAVLLASYIGVLAFIGVVGLRRLTAANASALGTLVVFILLFITAGFTLLAARGSDRVIRTMRDEISRRQRIEAALKRSNEDLEIFASTAVHDLGAPLRGVTGFARILQRDHAATLDPAGRELLGNVVKGAARMQDLVASLLDFAKAQSGQHRVEPVDLGAIARQVLGLLQPQVSAAKAKVTLGRLPRVLAPPAGMARVLQNLIENAIKFRHPQRAPRIRLEARRVGTDWEIAVSDNGVGIPAADLPEIGKPFRRARSSQRYEGSGLGLASAQRIVESAGGRLWVESQQDEGTTVRFRLPAAELAGKATDPSATPSGA